MLQMPQERTLCQQVYDAKEKDGNDGKDVFKVRQLEDPSADKKDRLDRS